MSERSTERTVYSPSAPPSDGWWEVMTPTAGQWKVLVVAGRIAGTGGPGTFGEKAAAKFAAWHRNGWIARRIGEQE